MRDSEVSGNAQEKNPHEYNKKKQDTQSHGVEFSCDTLENHVDCQRRWRNPKANMLCAT